MNEDKIRSLIQKVEPILEASIKDWNFIQNGSDGYFSSVEALRILLEIKEELSGKCSKSSKKFKQLSLLPNVDMDKVIPSRPLMIKENSSKPNKI